jgi:hypothetical protein
MNRAQPLGKNNRVVLPRCVVIAIRQKYPEDDENNYTGYIDPLTEQEQEA